MLDGTVPYHLSWLSLRVHLFLANRPISSGALYLVNHLVSSVHAVGYLGRYTLTSLLKSLPPERCTVSFKCAIVKHLVYTLQTVIIVFSGTVAYEMARSSGKAFMHDAKEPNKVVPEY